MKKEIFIKLASGILGIGLVVSLNLFTPQKAHGQAAVIDVASIAQQVITATNSGVQAASDYALKLKEFVLDGLAGALMKQLARQITASVVNWINSGFQGSPAFVTNPGAFFLDVADQVSGAFLAKVGGPLTELCSPFSIDIRLSLAFKYHPNNLQRYRCTIGTIIKNSKSAIKGATINGFTAGDFRQGGWPAFVSLTTEPQNNVIGAAFEADNEVSIRIAGFQIGKKQELDQGKGFLSWTDCSKNKDAFVEGEGTNETSDQYLRKTKLNCETKTPGSVIQGSLQNYLNGPLRQIELADEINEIVGALFAQLVTQVLTKGLSSVSGSGPSDSTSYINQIQKESTDDTSQVNSLRTNILKEIDTYISNADKYRQNKDASLNTVLEVKNLYDTARACYQGKLDGGPNSVALSPSQVADGRSRMATIDGIVSTAISSRAAILLTQAQSADKSYQTLKDIKDQVIAAKTVNDLNGPTQQYTQIIADKQFVSALEIQNSATELETVKNDMAAYKQDGLRKVQECQIFPSGSI